MENETPEPNFDLPEKQGWLDKRSTNLIRRWQPRYFILKNRILEYYHSESDAAPAMTVNFDQVSADLHFIDEAKCPLLLLSFSGCKRKFKLKAHNEENLYEWAEALSYHISDSRGTKTSLVSIASKDSFWRYARISNAQFIDSVQSGDILLFKSNDISAKLQRGLTQSSYDHVALLLKDENQLIELLESTSQYGVKKIYWSDFVENNWHLLYRRLVYRKLDCPRPLDFFTKLQTYITKVEGKKYSLSPSKLFKSKAPGQENSFFCSELVASAYKALGLLPKSPKSSSYLPVHFSSRKTMKLISSSLGQEFIIDFQILQ